MAEKKYPGDVDGLKKLEDKIMAGKGPQAGNTTVSILHSRCCCLSVAMYMFVISLFELCSVLYVHNMFMISLFYNRHTLKVLGVLYGALKGANRSYTFKVPIAHP